MAAFEVEKDPKYDFIANGLFGYSAYDAVTYYEDIKLRKHEVHNYQIPEIFYRVFRYVICINHQKEEFYLLDNLPSVKPIDIETILKKTIAKDYSFQVIGKERSSLSEDKHRELILKCKEHIARGDVFQIVPSRSFEQDYQGDDFRVYRALRLINPSPYLFYFDCLDFRIFGSSPEAELIISNACAQLHPIAGTCPRLDSEEENEKIN